MVVIGDTTANAPNGAVPKRPTISNGGVFDFLAMRKSYPRVEYTAEEDARDLASELTTVAPNTKVSE